MLAPVEVGHRIAVVPAAGVALHMGFVVFHVGAGALRAAILQVERYWDTEVMLPSDHLVAPKGEGECLVVPGVVLRTVDPHIDWILEGVGTAVALVGARQIAVLPVVGVV